MAKTRGSKSMLSGRYGLAQIPARPSVKPAIVDGALVASGVLLAYVVYPYQDAPLGRALISTAGGLIAVGIALFARDMFVDRRLPAS